MTGQYIVQGIFALAGIVSLLASLLNWDWFFTTRNAQTIVRNVGRNRARLFYGILGIIIIGMAIFFFVETRKAIETFFQTKEHKYKRLQKYVLLFLCLKQLS
mgnify:CR=1 FL=1